MTVAGPELVVPVSSRDHARGRPEAPLTLVEYGDFQCPHCALAHPVISDIARELGDSLRVVFRHFPLPGHPHAQRAAEAAEAAASQGRFWEMVDQLYQAGGELAEDFSRLAKKARLDLKQFNREMAAGAHRDRVRADMLGGIRSGVKGTPTVFLNGQRYPGRLDHDGLVGALLKTARSG